jgi:hypothetical protein
MRIKSFAIALGMLTIAAPGSAQQLFDFNGQADVPAAIGGTLNMYSVVFDAPPATAPLPLDFSNFEYTIVITGLVLDDIAIETRSYVGGTIALYEDNVTTADYTSPTTFSDGTAILSGVIPTLASSLLIGTIGTVSGSVDWTGGSRLGELAPADRLNWAILSGTNTNNALPGFDEVWDGKVEPQEPVIPTETNSWGRLKDRFGN